MEDYQSLTRTEKVKRVLPKVLPLLLLSVILPTADVGTDLILIIKLYRGLKAECVRSEGMVRYEEECEDQGAEKDCLDHASNQNVCGARLPSFAISLLFFFLVNYIMGLVTCLRLEGWKWPPIIAALFNVYPQYCK